MVHNFGDKAVFLSPVPIVNLDYVIVYSSSCVHKNF